MGYDPTKTRKAGPHNIVAPPPWSRFGSPTDAQDVSRGGDVDLAAMGYDPTKARKAGPQNIVGPPAAAAPGTGFAEDRSGPDDPARQAAIDAADALARAASANARTASEMRDALSHGRKTTIQDALDAKANDPRISLDAVLDAADDRTLYDAFVLLSSINIDYDQALAASGQALIQSKLSKADSM